MGSPGDRNSSPAQSIVSSRQSSFSSIQQFSEISYLPTYENGEGKSDICIRREQVFKIVSQALGNVSSFGFDLVHGEHTYMLQLYLIVEL